MTSSSPVQQRWVLGLSYMQQSVLFAAIRAPDGIRKDHCVKVLMRWYRRCVLISAFDGKALDDPFQDGGGSFTGPFTSRHFHHVINDGDPIDIAWWQEPATIGDKLQIFSLIRGAYLNHVDELPHHFQLHLMHASQIIGYKHPTPWIASWWNTFYRMIVNDAHLFPESEELMDKRLGDFEPAWRAREEVTAT